MYIWGFRARQHLRSLMPIMNDDGWQWRPNDIRGPWGPKASWHLSNRWGKTPKNLTQEICPKRGSNLRQLRDKCACYHLLHSGGLLLRNISICIRKNLIGSQKQKNIPITLFFIKRGEMKFLVIVFSRPTFFSQG